MTSDPPGPPITATAPTGIAAGSAGRVTKSRDPAGWAGAIDPVVSEMVRKSSELEERRHHEHHERPGRDDANRKGHRSFGRRQGLRGGAGHGRRAASQAAKDAGGQQEGDSRHQRSDQHGRRPRETGELPQALGRETLRDRCRTRQDLDDVGLEDRDRRPDCQRGRCCRGTQGRQRGTSAGALPRAGDDRRCAGRCVVRFRDREGEGRCCHGRAVGRVSRPAADRAIPRRSRCRYPADHDPRALAHAPRVVAPGLRGAVDDGASPRRSRPAARRRVRSRLRRAGPRLPPPGRPGAGPSRARCLHGPSRSPRGPGP